MSVDVIIPVYRPTEKLKKLLEMLQRQTYLPRQVLLLHTEDGSELELEGFPGLSITEVKIRQEAFDHGGTRDQGIRMAESEFVLLMTQDAVPADCYLVEELVKALEQDKNVAAAYARQIAGKDGDVLEAYTRAFNYPKESLVKSKKDLDRLGIKTFFCSNVCAAYRKAAYLELGGFEKKIIFNEDLLFAAKAIQKEWEIIYNAKAVVKHAHHYTWMQQLQRNFDQGVSQAMHPEVFEKFRSEKEGIRMIKQVMRELIRKKRFLQMILLITESGLKYTGYQLGKHYKWLPERVIMRLTMNQNYWKGRRGK